MTTKNFKYRFDETEGVFIRQSEISANWLISTILEKSIQITKATNDEIQKFLLILDSSDLRMPDGKHSLIWLKDHLKEKLTMTEAKDGEIWFNVAERFRFIIEQIDMTLVKSQNYEEKIKIVVEQQKTFKRTPNNITISFEPKT
jgi:hypothetical protein